MKLIVGLGNPGKEYKNNRHNAGFILIDLLAEKLGLSWKFERKFNAEICKNEEFVLVKPQTFMNDSGLSVSKAIKFFKIDLDNLVVVHDDVDLPFGETKFKKGSGTAGHHGVADIIEKLGNIDFWRFRVGVGRPENSKFDVHGYVLGDFSDEELSMLKNNIFKILTQKVLI